MTSLPLTPVQVYAIASRVDLATYTSILAWLLKRHQAGADLSAEIARCLAWLDRHGAVSRTDLLADNQRLTVEIAQLQARQHAKAKRHTRARTGQDEIDLMRMTPDERTAYLRANAAQIRAAR